MAEAATISKEYEPTDRGVIAVLPDHVVNQIAAGEVVDRPASVVRELVDNALDAEATEISVFLEDGGIQLIRVVDNGRGMSPRDVAVAFERHATSKLRSADDLISIRTLGFRGEALPSIASVAEVVIRTRLQGEDVGLGSELRITGGDKSAVVPVVTPPGTQVEVRNLFFNTPARRKFLKQPRSEETRIKHWLQAIATAHPTVRIRLVASGRELLALPAHRDWSERGRYQIKGAAVSFDETIDGYRIFGVVAHPSIAQLSPSGLMTFVNGRLVSDRMIVRAIKEGFDSTLKEREYPVGSVFIEVPTGAVDVNVHPQKSEVRFVDSSLVFRFTRRALLNSVRRFCSPVVDPARAVVGGTEFVEGGCAVREAPSNFGAESKGMFGSDARGTVYAGSAVPPPQIQSRLSFLSSRIESRSEGVGGAPAASAPVSVFQFSALQYLGQALGCYLLCQHQESLFVVDMHAAHERLNYNKIRNAYRERAVVSQPLLVPLAVTLSEHESALCLEHQELFTRFGFEIEAFGDSGILVRAVPGLMKGGNIVAFVREIATTDLDEDAQSRFEARIDHICARLACHASVRSGDALNATEVYALFADLDKTEFSSACPHGRPVVTSFRRDEIERWFGRDK